MVEFKFKSPTLQVERDPLCKRALSHFRQLPINKLLCYIDDEVPNYLPAMDSLPATHLAFSGLHVPIRGGGRWPHHVEKWFYTSEGEFAFDNLIYIPGTKYASDPVTFVMILAHEFRHFVQYGESDLASETNGILFRNVANFDTSARWWDIPAERDAMIVAKQVTEAEFGTDGLQRLIEKQIADRTDNKREVWTFLGSLSSAEAYNWQEQTRRIVQKHYSDFQGTTAAEEMETLAAYLQHG